MRGAPSIALSLRERAILYRWHKLRRQLRRLRRQHILGTDRAARLYRLRLGPVGASTRQHAKVVLGSMALAVLHAQNVVLGSLTLHRPSHRVRCEGCMANTRRSAEPLQLLGDFSDSGAISAGVHCPECAVCQFANDRHGQTAQLGLRAGTAEQPHREWQSVRRRAVHWLSNCRVQYDSVCINCLAGTCILEVGLRVRTDCPAGQYTSEDEQDTVGSCIDYSFTDSTTKPASLRVD